MKLACNIDARGRRVRATLGALLLLVGLIVAAAAYVSQFRAGYAMAIGLSAAGAFAIFEARKGWCAARAMGIKTPV